MFTQREELLKSHIKSLEEQLAGLRLTEAALKTSEGSIARSSITRRFQSEKRMSRRWKRLLTNSEAGGCVIFDDISTNIRNFWIRRSS